MNWLGLRIDFKETQDLFSKTAGRSGIYTYGPSDQDPADQIESVRDLIMCVHCRSGGQGRLGAWAAARLSRALLCGGELAGVGRSGATGARLGCCLVQKNERDTCDPLGPRARVGDGQSVELGGGGGAAAMGSSEPGVPTVPGLNSKH